MYSEHMLRKVGETFGCRKRDKGEFGIEIEVEGENLPGGRITQTFEGKADGSLRGGMEYVSKPVVIDDVVECVDNLRKQIAEMGAHIKPSYRCSTHIHHDFTNSSFKDVIGTIIGWSIVEPVAFRMIPPGRDGSLFCVSSYDSGELPIFMARFCEDIASKFADGFNPRGKYSSLNVTRLGPGEHHALGTLEYRIFPMSLDGRQIKDWCNWVRNLKLFATNQADPSYLSMVREAEQNPKRFIETIFGYCPFTQDQAGQMIDMGARTAFEMARVVNQNLKEKSKEKKQKKSEPLMILDDLPIPDPGVAANPAGNFPIPQLGAAARRRRVGLGGVRVGAGADAEGRPEAVQPRRARVARRVIPEPQPFINWNDDEGERF